MAVNYPGTRPASEASITVLTETEMAAWRRECGAQVIRRRGRYWEGRHGGFYQGLHWLARMTAVEARMPTLCYGYRVALAERDAHLANGSVPCEKAGHPFESFAPQNEGTIDDLAAGLGVPLPPSFRSFLRQYGGSGIVGGWLSGIWGSQPLLEQLGTVYVDTVRCPEQFGLPRHLAVIYCDSDEILWCLDTSQRRKDGENLL